MLKLHCFCIVDAGRGQYYDEGKEAPGLQEVHSIVCGPLHLLGRLAGGLGPGGVQLHVRLTLPVRGLQRPAVFIALPLRQRQMEVLVHDRHQSLLLDGAKLAILRRSTALPRWTVFHWQRQERRRRLYLPFLRRREVCGERWVDRLHQLHRWQVLVRGTGFGLR